MLLTTVPAVLACTEIEFAPVDAGSGRGDDTEVDIDIEARQFAEVAS